MAEGYDPLGASRTNFTDRNATSAMREKHPLPMLRVFESNYGNQWLMYGGFTGGTQDEQESCKWLLVFYRGIIRQDGKNVFGFWELMFTGNGLDSLAADLSRHALNWIRKGNNTQCEHPFHVEDIEFRAAEIVKNGDDEG